MSTNRKPHGKILGVISRDDAERLLLDWANLKGGDDSGQYLRLLKNHPKVFAELLPITSSTLITYRNRLRKAWEAPDIRHRDWYLFQFRSALEFTKRVNQSGEDIVALMQQDDGATRVQELLEPPPQVTPLEAALFYLQNKLADRAKYCGGPDCPAPYFIAEKRWQRYCSEKCAGPATRESKRRWWRENRAKDGGG